MYSCKLESYGLSCCQKHDFHITEHCLACVDSVMEEGWGVLSTFIKSFMRISQISLKNWHYRKNCIVVSVLMIQEHNGFKTSSKLSLDVNKAIWVDSTYHKLYYKYHFYKNVFKILTILYLEIPFSKNTYIDTSQLIFKSINWFICWFL